MDEREHHCEDGTLTEIALDLDTAVVQIRDPCTDSESKTRTLLRVGSSHVGSEEALENLLMVGRGNADAMVGDGEPRVPSVFQQRDFHFATWV